MTIHTTDTTIELIREGMVEGIHLDKSVAMQLKTGESYRLEGQEFFITRQVDLIMPPLEDSNQWYVTLVRAPQPAQQAI